MTETATIVLQDRAPRIITNSGTRGAPGAPGETLGQIDGGNATSIYGGTPEIDGEGA